MNRSHSPLLNALAQYAESSALPMHMPGHKRNTQLASYLSALGAQYDITEINGFDDLHEAEGILLESMRTAAQLWGSSHSFYLINGSTCGLLASIRAAAGQGGKVILTRGCHKSVYHAIELCQLEPVYLTPTLDPSFGVLASITPEQVQSALKAHPDAKLVILTSPTYEGVISDVASICRIAHTAGVPVLVDEAHGAHLGLAEGWPCGSVVSGADLVVQSLHKTLPSLTQTAILHQNGDLIDPQAVARQLGIFETSSPSYLLMSSMDGCVHFLQSEGKSAFADWKKALCAFDEAIGQLCHLRVLCHGNDHLCDHPLFFDHDPSKLVISTHGTPLTGPSLMERLRNDYAIELEMSSGNYAIAMTGMGDDTSRLLPLAQALCDIDKTLCKQENTVLPTGLCVPPRRLGVAAALNLPADLVLLDNAQGHISAEYVWAYPPGIPLIVPGEEISAAFVDSCHSLIVQGVRLHSTAGQMPDGILVTK